MGELEYLKRIAEALQKMLGQDNTAGQKTASALGTIADKIGTTNVEAIHVTNEGNFSLAGIDNTLHTGLIGQVESGGQTTDVAFISMLHDTLKKGLVYSYQDNGATVEKGLAQLISETKTVLEDIKKALDGTTTNGVAAKLNAIVGHQENIVKALDGTTANGVAKKVEAVATNIQTGDANIVSALGTTNTTLGNIYSSVNSIDGNTDGVEGTLSTISSTATSILNNMGGGGAPDLSYIENKIGSIDTTLDNIASDVSGMSSTLGDIDTNVSSIESQMPSSS